MLDIISCPTPRFVLPRDGNGNIPGEPIGVPVYVMFALLLRRLLSNTSAAYDLFRRSPFNDAAKNFLNNWGASA
jgi:phosphatidylserine decarboxylase